MSEDPDTPFSNLPSPPDGLPDVDRVRLEELAEEIREMQRHAAARAKINPEDPTTRVLRWAAERLRRRLWAASESIEEKTPKEIAAMLDVHPDTVRNWCKTKDVDHHRTPGGHYRVDVDSALAHVDGP